MPLGQVIKAFDMGVATMKLNEKCLLTCASDYAYGAAGSPPSIPPNSTLIFEVWIYCIYKVSVWLFITNKFNVIDFFM